MVKVIILIRSARYYVATVSTASLTFQNSKFALTTETRRNASR